MIAASSFIDSDFKTEDVKAECNKAVLNPLFCSIRVVKKTNNKKLTKSVQSHNGEILLKIRHKLWVNVDRCKILMLTNLVIKGQFTLKSYLCQ